MPDTSPAGPLGTGTSTSTRDEGTLARTTSPQAGSVGATPSAAAHAGGASGGTATSATDPEIEALNLRGSARIGAYALKKAHPSVKFTSGRRDKHDQARAMASNVVRNRKWIGETYAAGTVSNACQKWVDDNPNKKTQDEIAAGLLSVMNGATDADLAKLSKHLSGDAFDVQPVEGLGKFLDQEGGLVRWHAQF